MSKNSKKGVELRAKSNWMMMTIVNKKIGKDLFLYLEEAWEIDLLKLQLDGFGVHFGNGGRYILPYGKGLTAAPPWQVDEEGVCVTIHHLASPSGV